MANKFPSDFLTHLAQKPYIRGERTIHGNNHDGEEANFGDARVKVIGIELGDNVSKIFSECQLVSEKSEENHHSRCWTCGEVSILDFSQIKNRDIFRGEIFSRSYGMKEWDETKGPFNFFRIPWFRKSPALDNKYDNHLNKPDVIIRNVENFRLDVPSDILVLDMKDEIVPTMKKHLKSVFIEHHLNQREDYLESFFYQCGWKDGKRAAKKLAYLRGFKEGAKPKINK